MCARICLWTSRLNQQQLWVNTRLRACEHIRFDASELIGLLMNRKTYGREEDVSERASDNFANVEARVVACISGSQCRSHTTNLSARLRFRQEHSNWHHEDRVVDVCCVWALWRDARRLVRVNSLHQVACR